MNYDQVRDLLLMHLRSPEPEASRIYHDDAVLEFPQSGERFRGTASFSAWRAKYPAQVDYEPRELRGSGDLWVLEIGVRYDGGDPISGVDILQFRGDKVERETIYFAEPFPAPDWRKPWAEEGDPTQRRGDLPASLAVGD